MKTVHGPEAHITKKQRSDLMPRPPGPRDKSENNAGGRERLQREKMFDNGSPRGAEDYLHTRSIKTETSVVRWLGRMSGHKHEGRESLSPASRLIFCFSSFTHFPNGQKLLR